MNQEMSQEASAARYYERICERVRKQQLAEAALAREQQAKPKPKPKPQAPWVRGTGVVRRDEWKPGELRITQEAMTVVYDYVTRKAAGQSVGRREWSQKAGISAASFGEYAADLRNGEIALDHATRTWKRVSR